MAAVLVASTLLLVALLVGAATLQGVAGMSILPCICSLETGQYIENGPYRLAMEDDCNLALTQNAQLLWREGGNGVKCKAEVEGTGDLVIKDSGDNVLWRSHSQIHVNRNYLILDSTGKLSIRTLNDGDVLWSAPYPPPGPAPAPPALPGPPPSPPASPTVWEIKRVGAPYMVAGYRLRVDIPLQSGDFSLTLNGSCCLARSNRNGKIEWQSETCGSAGDDCSALLLRENGTLQILRATGGVAWQSKYSGPASVDSYVLLLETNGDVSVFDSLNLKSAKRVWTGFGGVGKKGIEWWKVLGIVAGGIAVVAALGVIFWLSAGYGKPQVLSLAEIRQATDDFKTKKLGEDGFGTVYHGRLYDGQDVAVKDLSATSRQGKPEFSNEIKLLSQAHHKYLVRLVGYCLTSEKQILVYEYISGGNLQGRLHGEMASSNPLTWRERTSIILQVAEGIAYLHDGCPTPIIHGDLKSSNILLTDKMIAKVADFGLSKLVGDDSTTGNLTEKSDVYAFGVVLMETLTGGPVTDEDGVFIGMRVRQAVESGQLELLADSTPGSYDVQQFSELMTLATRCVKENGNDRPSMTQVVRELTETGLVQLDPRVYGQTG